MSPELNQTQKTKLKTAIINDPNLTTALNSNDYFTIANYLNVVVSPDFIVWKTSVNPNDIMKNGMDWTRVDNLSVGKARIWDWLTRLGNFNAAKPNVRAGIDATWVGTAADLAVRDSVYSHCKRSATVVEKVLATGTGSTVSPAVCGSEGPITIWEVERVLVEG